MSPAVAATVSVPSRLSDTSKSCTVMSFAPLWDAGLTFMVNVVRVPAKGFLKGWTKMRL